MSRARRAGGCGSWSSRTKSGWQALLKRGLSEEGHAVDLAESGEDALAWIDTADYDVIVLDVMLPGINGLDVCRAIRRAAAPHTRSCC